MSAAEFPEGYRAVLTDKHDGTGGGYVVLLGPDGEEVDRVGGGGWNDVPFHVLARSARLYEAGRQAGMGNGQK